MIGLVWKDFLVMRKSLRSYAMFLVFYAVLAVMGMFDLAIVTAMIQVILLMLPIGAFSYDEQARWDRFAPVLPLSRRQIVGARYLFTLLLALAAAVVGLVTGMALSFTAGPLAWMENLLTVLVALGAGLFIVDVLLPLCYKLGPERARPYLYGVVFIPWLLLFGAYKLELIRDFDLTALERLSQPSVFLLFSLIPLTALAGLGVSFLISCRIMEKKEY